MNNERMSEPDGKSDNVTQAFTAPQGEFQRFELYSKFYTQACLLAIVPKDVKETPDEIEKRNHRIVVTLETITKLIFGLDGENKSKVVLFGGGALELIVALVRRSNALNQKCDDDAAQKIILSALKTIKTCVLRNSSGRSRCRSSGALDMVCQVLEKHLTGGNVVLIEEAFTTLAAMCLGNDLNALQASTKVKPFITKSKAIYPNESQMHQKTLYLETLFAAIEKEQSSLIKYTNGKNTMTAFFNDIDEAEKDLRTGIGHSEIKNYAAALKHYNHAMRLIEPFLQKTKLLDDLVTEIRFNRIFATSNTENAELCLVDTSILLDMKSPIDKTKLLKMHGKALIEVGRIEEGKESLAKLRIMSPEDAEVSELLSKLEV